MMDLERITHPLRLASGSHQPGSGKGCAMNVISYINGDTVITDYPECSARPLARMVQGLNDRLAGFEGFLSPENSVIVLGLGWKTVGTAGTPREVVWRWLADILVDPEMGVVKYARLDGAVAIRRVAELCVREAGGDSVPKSEWAEAKKAAAAAAAGRRGAESPQWVEVKAKLLKTLGPDVMASWIDQVEFLGIKDGVVGLAGPSAFVRDQVTQQYGPKILDAWQSVEPDALRVAVGILKMEPVA